MQAHMISFRRLAINCFNLFRDACLAVASREINKEVIRREADRGCKTLRWFTPDEVVVIEALIKIIIPSDEENPGIDEVGVLDPPAIVTLDHLVAASPHRQQLYSRGLLSFDKWALRKRGCRFAEMPTEDQIELFSTAQKIHEASSRESSEIRKAWSRLQLIAQVKKGAFYAAQLYPQIREDCFRVFYTSRVSWIWLGYDGPPMEKGYPSLTSAREP